MIWLILFVAGIAFVVHKVAHMTDNEETKKSNVSKVDSLYHFDYEKDPYSTVDGKYRMNVLTSNEKKFLKLIKNLPSFMIIKETKRARYKHIYFRNRFIYLKFKDSFKTEDKIAVAISLLNERAYRFACGKYFKDALDANDFRDSLALFSNSRSQKDINDFEYELYNYFIPLYEKIGRYELAIELIEKNKKLIPRLNYIDEDSKQMQIETLIGKQDERLAKIQKKMLENKTRKLKPIEADYYRTLEEMDNLLSINGII